MNVFAFSDNPMLCAEWQCDKHVNKMCIEATQILNTALHRVDASDIAFYGKTHTNHPCCMWAARSFENWRWLYQHAMALGGEFSARYGGDHKSVTKLRSLDLARVREVIPYSEFEQPPQAMPDEVKQECTYTAYREYYRQYKQPQDWFSYEKGRSPPSWL